MKLSYVNKIHNTAMRDHQNWALMSVLSVKGEVANANTDLLRVE
jgi:hypothetical protein